MPCHIIRKIRTAHCKRGPEVREKCRQMDVECICPPDAGQVQRRAFDVVRME